MDGEVSIMYTIACLDAAVGGVGVARFILK